MERNGATGSIYPGNPEVDRVPFEVASHVVSHVIPSHYSLDRNIGIPGPFGHGNRLTTCKYIAMQPQLSGGGLGAL